MNIPLTLLANWVEDEKQEHEDWKTRMNAEAEHSAEPCDVYVCERTAGLPGGAAANEVLGARHWWLKTPDMESGQGKLGGGVPANGDPQPWTLTTTFNDHRGESQTADACTPICSADADAVDRTAAIGRPTGAWLVGINDCNNQVQDALREAGVPEGDIPPAPEHLDWVHALYKPYKDELQAVWDEDRAGAQLRSEDAMSDE
ncbi:MAG: hypothetical protein U1E65_21620 [Myxococcota bacterium]